MDVIEGLLDRSLLIILREGPRFSMLRSIFDFVKNGSFPVVKMLFLDMFSDMVNGHAPSRVLSTWWG